MTAPRVPVRRRRLAGAALAGALLALAGCSDSGGGGGGSGATSTPPTGSASASAAPTGAPSATVVIKNFAFGPAALTVRPGSTVLVKNDDTTAHTLTAVDNSSFDTGTIGPGSSATFTAPKHAGMFDYICTIHPFMKGTLSVG
ncbi:Plastocyanin [Streptomyces sp. DvalAA-14]|uniref:cupredoxin domain-containing protein n=1 Tax=unclassified Streptomyces TaxID=2593676 RepID=UPI00081BA85C|nr:MULTISPECIES: cupredoxin domain-containing protein [unclassified Streptomyces]MYS20309.1 metal-binding protein [Streptomyces sp. SID4948]SCD65704.1 Plastocyanin [Streptomyces sp. DvalAA-14]